MEDNIIWDGVLENYRQCLLEEIVNSVPSIQVIIDINIIYKLHEALDSAQAHHVRHVADTNLKEKNLDAYKAFSWISCMMSHLCKKTVVFECAVSAGIKALNNCLIQERWKNNGLPEKTLNLMNVMFKNELIGIPEHGIERNGLFLSFHSALEILKNK